MWDFPRSAYLGRITSVTPSRIYIYSSLKMHFHPKGSFFYYLFFKVIGSTCSDFTGAVSDQVCSNLGLQRCKQCQLTFISKNRRAEIEMMP